MELLPCPFCGAKAHWFYSLKAVVCMVCESTSPTEKQWNMRTFPAKQKPRSDKASSVNLVCETQPVYAVSPMKTRAVRIPKTHAKPTPARKGKKP